MGPRWDFPQHAPQIPSMEMFLPFSLLRYYEFSLQDKNSVPKQMFVWELVAALPDKGKAMPVAKSLVGNGRSLWAPVLFGGGWAHPMAQGCGQHSTGLEAMHHCVQHCPSLELVEWSPGQDHSRDAFKYLFLLTNCWTTAAWVTSVTKSFILPVVMGRRAGKVPVLFSSSHWSFRKLGYFTCYSGV